MENCKYHPLVDAEYYCQYCETDVCLKCSREPSDNGEFRCFLCNANLTQINPEKNIPPFWRQIPELHRYPLNTSGIAAIFLTAILQTIFYQYGSILAGVATLGILLYCFSCLNETANGELRAPSFMDVFSGDANIIISLIGIYIVSMIFLGAVFSFLGFGLGVLCSILLVAAVPAILMMLAIERSFLMALHVGKIIRIISVCGSSYFVMLMFIFLLLGSKEFVSSLYIGESFSVWIFFSSVISNYYMLVIFHVMGYMIYQNSYALEFDSKEIKPESVKTRSPEKLAEMEVEILLKEGQFKQAIQNYGNLLKSNMHNSLYWKNYAKLITETRNGSLVKKFAAKYFEHLLEKEDKLELALSYKKFKRIAPDLHIADQVASLKIAKALYQTKNYSIMIPLLQSSDQASANESIEKQRKDLLMKAYEKIPKQKRV